MAIIPVTPNRSRMPTSPSVPRIGGTVTADDMGGTQARQFQQLGETSNRAANTLQRFQIERDHEREKINSDNALLVYQEQVDKEWQRLSQIKGDAVYDVEKQLTEFSNKAAEDALSGLKNPLGKDLFNKNRQFYDYRNRTAVSRYIQEQHQVNREVSLNAKIDRAVVDTYADPSTVAQQIQKGLEVNQELYGKYGTEKLDLENIKTASLMVSKAAESLAANPDAGPSEVLKMLDDEEVTKYLPSGVVQSMKVQYGKQMIEGAKKQSENAMRQLGIQLGDKYDNEYEIIDALRDVEDRELAKIAREEAETVRKARLAMGSDKKLTPEEKAKDDRVSRDLAQTIIRGVDQEDSADDVTDEEELDAALDTALSKATEARREKVRKYAMAELKTRRVRQARERKELDQTALETMSKSGWDVSAIDPSWPQDLQDKMLERIEKRDEAAARKEARMEKAEKKANGLSYLDMPLEQLNEKILAGEWPDIVDAVGAGTPEHKKLEARLKGEESSGLTMLQYAKNEFTRIIGDPNKRKTKFAAFNQKVDEARKEKARELKLDNPDMIPVVVQEKIVRDMLALGDYGGIFDDQYRFEVPDEKIDKWTPFDTPVPPARQFPSFAHPYFSPRDQRREVLSNGNVLIESGNGVVTIIKPDGTMLPLAPKGNQ